MSAFGFGVVVIGRNEGERLRRCLESVISSAALVVYVDSGSTDGSAAMARAMGAEVVDLDMRLPFTAARARNEGFQRLMQSLPELPYVQFVDGDCEVVPQWLPQAIDFLDKNETVAAVCGRRRERFPERSVFNALCDSEWDTPVGQTRSCGGDVMMRTSALVTVGGYRSDLIAGEEPELCVRLRQAGWKIWRLGQEMTLHDAAITRFGQWWRRTMRGGYAFAQGAHLHGAPPECHCVKPVRRLWFWGLGMPLLATAASLVHPLGALLFAVYPLQILRLALRGGLHTRQSWVEAFFLVLGKFPEMLGAAKFLSHRLSGRAGQLIEYK